MKNTHRDEEGSSKSETTTKGRRAKGTPTPDASCLHQVTGNRWHGTVDSFLVWLITLINPKQPEQSTSFVTSSCSSAFNCIAFSSHYRGLSAAKNRNQQSSVLIVIVSAHRQKHEAAGLIPISVTALIFQQLLDRKFLVRTPTPDAACSTRQAQVERLPTVARA